MEDRKKLDFTDFDQCSRLIWKIANKEFMRYQVRVSYTKLEKEDFYQNGWVAMQDCINKGMDDLNYICVAIRNAMYRGVENSAIVRTTKKEDLWFYISGHNKQLEDKISQQAQSKDEGLYEYKDILVCEDTPLEDTAINKVLTQQVIDSMNEDDKIELIRIMLGLPPKRRRKSSTAKRRAWEVLNGREPYRQVVAEKQSSISGVTYDKSKDRWVFSKRVEGKVKKFKASRDRNEVEEFAKRYYENLKVSS